MAQSVRRRGARFAPTLPWHPLHEFLEQSARTYPERPAVIFKNHSLTYRQLNDLSDRLAAALADLGVEKGDRVAMFNPNAPRIPLAFYGYIYIVDRKKDMVIVSGFNVYPTNVEEVLIQHPKILDVTVAGAKDPHRGETVKAWVVLRPGETATEDEIIEWARNSGQLAAFERPRIVEFRDEMPKTLVGKVLRRALVEGSEKTA